MAGSLRYQAAAHRAEVKFSHNWLAGMTLQGDGTGDDGLFTDTIAEAGRTFRRTDQRDR